MASSARTLRWWAVTALVALATGACSPSSGDDAVPPLPRPALVTTTTTSSTTTSSSSTTTAPPSTTVTTAPLPGLGRGARGPEVQALEQRLAELKYDVGRVDGVFDGLTTHGVLAFQKVQGMERTGRATDDVLAALAGAKPPGPILSTGGPTRVEIDLKRQVLLLWQDNALVRVLPVSTGTGKRYCVEGECAKAVTPGGSFRVVRKIRGLRVSRLGQLYNPLYFNGGIAIHGSPSVPRFPASHGCVRIPMAASPWFFDTVATGTPVYVFGGPIAPVPFNEPTPGEPPPGPPSTTSTTAPTTTTTALPTTTTPVLETTTTTTTTTTTSTTILSP